MKHAVEFDWTADEKISNSVWNEFLAKVNVLTNPNALFLAQPYPFSDKYSPLKAVNLIHNAAKICKTQQYRKVYMMCEAF